MEKYQYIFAYFILVKQSLHLVYFVLSAVLKEPFSTFLWEFGVAGRERERTVLSDGNNWQLVPKNHWENMHAHNNEQIANSGK